MRKVPANEYSTEYFEHDCGGHEDWRDSRGQKLPPRLEYVRSLAKFAPGMKALDWGSGRGELSYQAAKAGCDVLGLDYAPSAIELSRKLPKDTVGKMRFSLIDDLTIPAKDGEFEVILFVDVIEHLYPEQLKVLLAEFARVLSPTGKLILHTFPNREHYDLGYPYYTRYLNWLMNPIWQILFKEKLGTAKSPRQKYDAKMHVNECSLLEVQKFLTDAGLAGRVWYDSKWRMIRWRDKLRYLVCQPYWLSKRFFADDIWAVVGKSAR
jgi:cyclopropane fatty-acyl-phospholipid synthase-like methyltransferase